MNRQWQTRLRQGVPVLLVATLLLNLFFLPTQTGVAHAALESTIASLNITGLEDLGADFVYEGWAITADGPVSTGRFSVDAMGTPSQTDFPMQIDRATITNFVLTIEPAVGDDPAPAATHLVAGDVVDNVAALSIAHPAALGDDFTAATGEYILAVPTADGNAGADYFNGIWFLNPADPSARMTAGLNLPTLPEGWAYEGWVVDGNGPVSTGTFLDPAAADSDGGGATAGPNAAPPFPGQDFVTNLRDLRGGAAVISVEPVPDNSPAPFTLKPLVDMMVDDTGAPGIVQAMGNNAAATSASGTATFFASAEFSISCNGLEDLGADFVYEGWLIDGGPISTGIFTVDSNGNLSSTGGTIGLNNVAAATPFVLTIEPAVDPDPAPAATHVVAGDVVNGLATATIAHPAALGNDFTSATGEYILAVPTADGNAGADYFNGIWFLNAGAAGLDLPTLPAGWAYEGWVVDANGPVSTGTFLDVAAADSDGGGATAGPNAAPPFPGQDFVTNLRDLRGGSAVISIEPVPDNSPNPFTFKPLVDMVVDDTGAPGIAQSMANNPIDVTCNVEVTASQVTAVGLGAVSADSNSQLILITTLTLIGALGLATLRLRKEQ